jgi:hypothetical protein
MSATAATCLWVSLELGFDVAEAGRSDAMSWVGPWTPIDARGASDRTSALLALSCGSNPHALIRFLQSHPDVPSASPLVVAFREALQGRSFGMDLAPRERRLVALAQTFAERGEIAACSRPPPDAARAYLEAGPSLVVGVLADTIGALRDNGVGEAFVSGSLAMFLQRPFRLSPDVDLTLPATTDKQPVRAALAKLGATDIVEGRRYIGGTIPGRVPVSVDIEFGTSYRVPLDVETCRRQSVSAGGWRVFSSTLLIELKRRAGRLKDAVDLEMVSS